MTAKEALEKLTNYKCSSMSERIECKDIIETALNRLEQAEKFQIDICDDLKRLDMLERVLKIIKEKKTFVALLVNCNTFHEYNSHVQWENAFLTETEFNLLKEYFK